MTRILPFVAFLAACSAGPAANGPDTDALHFEAGEVIEGEFIISTDVPDSMLSELGLERVHFNDRMGAGLYRADAGTQLTVLETALKEKLSGSELRVEHNRPYQRTSVSNDEFRPLQWNFDMLDINTSWDMARGKGRGVVVAVIDSGVSDGLEDSPVNFIKGHDYVDGDEEPYDLNGHGTHVAGTIAQASHNNDGVAGVAPLSTILGIRALDANGSGNSYWIASAIYEAVDKGADVINMSLGAPVGTSFEQEAVQYAASQDVVIVAASGNDGWNQVGYPAAYPEVISVGAVRYDGSVTSYSNGGTGLDVVAPGGDTWYDQNGDGYGDGILQETITGYEFFQGTSMASPHVAGIVALLLGEGAAPDDIYDILTLTASNDGDWDIRSGYGLVSPVDALAAIGQTSGNPGGGNPGGGNPGTSNPGTNPGPGPSNPPQDVTAPSIFDVWAWRSGNSMTLGWETDEPSITALDFDGYGVFSVQGTMRTEHEMDFTVDAWETYFFTILSEDAVGNTGSSGTWQVNP